MIGDVPSTAFAICTVIALFLAVREARRVASGDQSARTWFIFFVASAFIMTVCGVDGLFRPPPGR